MKQSHRDQRGFTLIELMVSLLVSVLLVAMILSIFLRMSLSYRGQQEAASLQQRLAYARDWVEQDAKQAGYGIAPGFRIAADVATGLWHSPIEVVNSSTASDEVSFYYADANVQSLVVAPSSTGGNWPAKLIVDNAAGFVANDLVVLSTPSFENSPVSPAESPVVRYDSCVLQIQSVSTGTPATVTFSTALPWGILNQTHCTAPRDGVTMLFKFVARAYRLAPDRPDLGVLQLSTTGNLYGAGVFQDVAYNFTDLQVTGYFRDADGLDSQDPDVDPNRDWYSSTSVQTFTAPSANQNPFVPLLQVGFTFVARSSRNLDGIGTQATPDLNVGGNTTNNVLGDRNAVALSGTADPRLQGNRIYRYTTSYVDLRNMGVGR